MLFHDLVLTLQVVGIFLAFVFIVPCFLGLSESDTLSGYQLPLPQIVCFAAVVINENPLDSIVHLSKMAVSDEADAQRV